MIDANAEARMAGYDDLPATLRRFLQATAARWPTADLAERYHAWIAEGAPPAWAEARLLAEMAVNEALDGEGAIEDFGPGGSPALCAAAGVRPLRFHVRKPPRSGRRAFNVHSRKRKPKELLWGT